MKVLSRDHGAGLLCHLDAFFQGYLLLCESSFCCYCFVCCFWFGSSRNACVFWSQVLGVELRKCLCGQVGDGNGGCS